jgi:hypothetical protein
VLGRELSFIVSADVDTHHVRAKADAFLGMHDEAGGMAHAQARFHDKTGANKPYEMIEVFRLLRTYMSFGRFRQSLQCLLETWMDMGVLARRKE